MKIIKQIAGGLILGVTLMSVGCGSLGARMGYMLSTQIGDDNYKLGIYPGVRGDVRAIWKAPKQAVEGQPCALILSPLLLADVPLSAVTDTCFLGSDIHEQ